MSSAQQHSYKPPCLPGVSAWRKGSKLSPNLSLSLGITLGLSLLLSACADTSAPPPPAALEALSVGVQNRAVQQVWRQTLGAAEGVLAPTLASQSWVVADNAGRIVALNVANGAPLWQAQSPKALRAGVGSDGRFAAVVDQDVTLRLFDAGKPLWLQSLPSLPVAAPLVAGERVFVSLQDQSVLALDALNGRLLWHVQGNKQVNAQGSAQGNTPGIGGGSADASASGLAASGLAVALPGVLTVAKGQLLASQGSQLSLLNPDTGAVLWTKTAGVGQRRGNNEIERLAPALAPAAVQGNEACVHSFNSGVQCLNLGNGQASWQLAIQGSTGVAARGGLVYGVDGNDRLYAWSRPDTSPVWRNDRLLNRGLTAPALLNPAVLAVGDAQGYVHFVDAQNGATLARSAALGSAVRWVQALGASNPNAVLVHTQAGQVLLLSL